MDMNSSQSYDHFLIKIIKDYQRLCPSHNVIRPNRRKYKINFYDLCDCQKKYT